jgi:hypothetical protein
MKYKKLFPFVIFVILFNLMTACSPATVSVPTETTTITPIPATPTNTPKPTATPKPTITPDMAATQQIKDFEAVMQDFMEKEYVAGTDGEVFHLDDFSQDWPQLGWYQWWPAQETSADFVFKSHIAWSSASDTPEVSGCGISFGVQENGDHYAVFIDKSRIQYLMGRGSRVYNVGKTRGSGRLSFGNPAEADLVVSVKGQSSYVSVNGDVTEYTLSQDQSTKGVFAYSILSGTNKDYGTHCEMTDTILWMAK